MPELFSDSIIWKLQELYFAQSGIDAWRKGDVPHYVTSNAHAGKTYAEIVFAFLHDLARQGNISETIYILEVGAGHGRFCYHFLVHLEKLVEGAGQELPPYCYILSDFAEANLLFWNDHPRLQRFYQEGRLDHCILHVKDNRDLFLRFTNKRIGMGELSHPLLVIANYFFDSIPQELFFIHNKMLHTCSVSIDTALDESTPSAADIIRELEVIETSVDAVCNTYYDDPLLDDILAVYLDTSEQDNYLLFPDAGIRFIEQLRGFSVEGILLITADHGYHTLADAVHRPFPRMIKHGCFSYAVNYHAIKTYCEGQGGEALFPIYQHDSVITGCLLMLRSANNYSRTMQAYERLSDSLTTDDFFVLKRFFVAEQELCNLPELFAVVKLSSYDPRLFFQLIPSFKELAPDLSDNERHDLLEICHRVWETYYPIGEPDDLGFAIGEVLFALEYPEEAVIFFELSEKIYGTSEERGYQIALCRYLERNYDAAFIKALAVRDSYPGNKEVTALVSVLEKKRVTNGA